MNTELSHVRGVLLDALYQAVDLDIRLLHSTEIQHTVVAREHEAIVGIIERLRKHPQAAHIQQYSPLNQQEFERAEPQYLENFTAELRDRIQSMRTILDLSPDETPAGATADTLADHMRETMRAGAPNQFTEAHIAFIRTIADPAAYYGRKVAEDALGISLAEAAKEKPSEPPPRDTTADQLIKVKADVLTHAVRHYDALHPRVVALTLIKTKSWLATSTPHLAGRDDATAFCEGGAAKEGVTLFSSNPRSLTFGLVGPTGARAFVHWGLDNAAVRLAVPSSDAPPFYKPSVSVVLFSGPGTVSGTAYVLASDDLNDLDALAMLAKKLDFASDYLALASAAVPDERQQAADHDKEAELLSIAEDL